MLPSNLFSMNDDFAEELGIDNKFDTSCNVLLVTGPNASGKSFLRRWINHFLKLENIECIQLSQQGRTNRWAGSCFVYGSEDEESTGYNSARTFIVGVKTSRSRDKSHVLLWDEPEIGMGEELQLGSAIWMREQLSDFPKNLLGVILLTHSNVFVREMSKMKNVKFFNLCDRMTINEWMKRDIVPLFPEEISRLGIEKW